MSSPSPGPSRTGTGSSHMLSVGPYTRVSSRSVSSRTRAASVIAKSPGSMRYWLEQRKVTVHMQGINLGNPHNESFDLPASIRNICNTILQPYAASQLNKTSDDIYRRIFSFNAENASAFDSLLRAISDLESTNGADAGIVLEPQSIIDSVRVSVIFARRLAVDEALESDTITSIVHRTGEATCRIPLDFLFESGWVPQSTEQIVTHEPIWRLPKVVSSNQVKPKLEPKEFRPDTVFAIRLLPGQPDPRYARVWMNLVSHVPLPNRPWGSFDFSFFIVEYKIDQNGLSSALGQLTMSITCALRHLEAFGVSGEEYPVFGMAVCRNIASLIVGWQHDGEITIKDVPDWTLDLVEPINCITLSSTILLLRKYSRKLKEKAQIGWNRMNANSLAQDYDGWAIVG